MSESLKFGQLFINCSIQSQFSEVVSEGKGRANSDAPEKKKNAK